jgi:hypothetical protein
LDTTAFHLWIDPVIAGGALKYPEDDSFAASGTGDSTIGAAGYGSGDAAGVGAGNSAGVTAGVAGDGAALEELASALAEAGEPAAASERPATAELETLADASSCET